MAKEDNSTLLIVGGLLIAGYFLFRNKGTSSGNVSASDVVSAFEKIYPSDSTFNAAVTRMSQSELNAVYRLMTDFNGRGDLVPVNDPLSAQLRQISVKYNIFT